VLIVHSKLYSLVEDGSDKKLGMTVKGSENKIALYHIFPSFQYLASDKILTLNSFQDRLLPDLSFPRIFYQTSQYYARCMYPSNKSYAIF